MKRSLYILTTCLLLGVLLLTACDRDTLYQEWEGSELSVVNGTVNSYLNLRIVKGSPNTTRATAAEENAIYDGILIFFVGNGETSAKLKSAVVIDQLINNPGSSNTVNIVQQLPINLRPYPASGSGKIYVMALLNTTSTGFSVSDNMLYLNGTSLADKTRGQLQAMKVNSVGSTDKHVGLYMASKPKGTGSTPEQTAIQIYDPDLTPQYLYDSQSDITSTSEKLTLNVERAAAKVCVTNSIGTNPLSTISINGTDNHPKVHAMRWNVKNYNLKSFAIRYSSGTNTPEYPAISNKWFASGDDFYMGENTSAEVVVELQLKDASSVLLTPLYIYNGVTDRVFTSETEAQNYIGGGYTAANLTLCTDGKVYYTFKVNNDNTMNYLVERNTFYNLTLKTSSITSVGRPTP